MKNEYQTISKLLKKYNNNKVDDNFIYDVINIIINSYNLNDYIKKIKIENYKPNLSYGSYEYFTGNLIIRKNFHDESNLSYNINILQNIMHEIEHVIQYDYLIKCNKKIIIPNNLIKANLLTDSINQKIILETLKNKSDNFDLNIQNELYNCENIVEAIEELYIYDPSERMAEIDSLKKLLEIVKLLNDDRLTNIINFNLIQKLNIGYDDNCPIFNFYTGLSDMIDNEYLKVIINNYLINYNYLTLEDKLYYGLPRNDMEYQNQLNKMYNLKYIV